LKSTKQNRDNSFWYFSLPKSTKKRALAFYPKEKFILSGGKLALSERKFTLSVGKFILSEGKIHFIFEKRIFPASV